MALTHKSAARSAERSNERLEFLGDAILGFVVAEFLLTALPRVNEGTLSRARSTIVRRETLAAAARAIGIEDLLAVGASEIKQEAKTRNSVLADAYEAVVGALYLDQGDAAARGFVRATLGGAMDAAAAAPPEPDPKTRLQILLQARGRGLPTYRIVAESGAIHNRRFVAEVLAGETPLGEGEGVSKRAATERAAAAALATLEGAATGPGKDSIS